MINGFPAFIYGISSISILNHCNLIELLDSHIGHQQVSDLVVLGIGSLMSNKASRLQLILAQAVARHLHCDRIISFDPCFNINDIAVLHVLNIDVLSENTAGKEVYKRPTVVFMPHCPKQLYDNVLVSNLFTAQPTSQLMGMLGNNLSMYVETAVNEKLFASTYPGIYRIGKNESKIYPIKHPRKLTQSHMVCIVSFIANY